MTVLALKLNKTSKRILLENNFWQPYQIRLGYTHKSFIHCINKKGLILPNWTFTQTFTPTCQIFWHGYTQGIALRQLITYIFLLNFVKNQEQDNEPKEKDLWQIAHSFKYESSGQIWWSILVWVLCKHWNAFTLQC